MIESKSGNIDIDYFKNIIQEHPKCVCGHDDEISGWILDFFAYYNNEVNDEIKIEKFFEHRISIYELNNFPNQMLIIPFKIIDEGAMKAYDMKYHVGFIGCDQNEKKEISLVQGWIVSQSTKKEKKSIL